jgi:nucleoside-diphosphate-sugar epimerase
VIYITGATGFIGERLARRLLARGEPIRCLIRSDHRGQTLRRLGAEVIVGEVSDVHAHRAGLRDARLGVHLAATYDVGVVDPAVMHKTNVEGTRAFLTAIEQTQTPWAVYVSTTVALGPTTDASDREPRDAYDGPYPSHYHRTKAEAHKLARAAQARGVPIIIVCPSFVYGPGDTGPGGRFIKDILRRRVPGLLTTPGWFSYVFVDDVVDGLITASDQGTIGETYLLTGEAASMNDFAERVARLGGVSPPPFRFPPGLAQFTGSVLDVIARMTSLRFPITREGVATTATDKWLHTHERATRDLGYAPRSLDQGLPDTIPAFKR